MDRIDFQVDKFDKLITEKGMNILWQEAMLCFCMGENKGQPNFNCKWCKGSGYLYSTPISTVAVISKLGGDQNFEPIGNRSVGDAYLTPLSSIIMGWHDRIIFTDLSSKYSEAISIKYGKSLKLKHQVKKIVSAQYRDSILDLEKVQIINDGWNIQIDSGYMTSEGLDNDFYLSILYTTSPIYSIIDIPHELRGTQVGNSKNFVELSKQYLIKREDLTYVQIQS